MNELPVLLDSEDKSSQIKNCIRKNYKHIRKWAKRTTTNAFRIYDRDIKEYPLAIEFYDGRFCVQYFSYDPTNDEPSPELKEEIDLLLHSLFGAKTDDIFWRSRIRRKKREQYEKKDEKKHFFPVLEYGVKFWINLEDYLDTGLFLDHRETRQMVAKMAKGKRVLNLFAYTCSFSVHAAFHGASLTKSVDMSNTYTDWGRRNFELNHLEEKTNPILREDCLRFLQKERQNFDIIVIDPPTLSRSKKMDQMFDVQLDYVSLIERGLKLLSPGGVIFFSTNSRKFKFDLSKFPAAEIREITKKTIPLDFSNQKIHLCWKITNKE